ncbi:ABC transporter ATP-binding protein [Acuticoccus kandeliae]|uniref:ABC transporter ATP-binding protein n=1 Tax=Acuticoccus kandeliae TaxID=2073160 RepID=UPI000D3EC925|nr:ABC transporter ATP-binding protein [Acuticoccus kandeliae]
MSALLTVRGVTRSFYGVSALSGVDFEIGEGTLTGLIGPNGAGKSTLFNVVSGLFPPDGGRVSFAGEDITGRPPKRVVERGLVRTFQLARGFPKLSVFQHLMLYGPHQPGEHLWAALSRAATGRKREEELAERAFGIARRLKLDHVIDNAVTHLSGGQKKLLEIGRALMSEPRMILLDEPMAGVNPTLTGEIAAHLADLHRSGITICLIEHDMALIRQLCDPVIVMAEGRTLTEGTFAEVAADTRVQEAYLGRRH